MTQLLPEAALDETGHQPTTAVRPAAKRRLAAPPACTVGLDLRVPGRVGAVAVDGRGHLRAWALIADDDPARDLSGGNTEALTQQALRGLAVRPLAVRGLIGSQTAPVALVNSPTAPAAPRIADALLDEGYEPIPDPASVTEPLGPDTWLVAQASESRLDNSAETLSDLSAIEPTFVVDQALIARRLDQPSVAVDSGALGLSIVASSAAASFARSLPRIADLAEAADEIRRTLEVSQADGLEISVFGGGRRALRDSLERQGFETVCPDLPTLGGEPLPAELQLAYELARETDEPALQGPRLEERQRSARRARQVALAGIVLGCLGVGMVGYGLIERLASLSRQRALSAEITEVGAQMQELQTIAGLTQEVRDLRAQLDHTLPWPRLAATVARLADECPERVGWEKLTLTDGALELEASAFGPRPNAELERLRWTLEGSPGLINPAWDEPDSESADGRLGQTFRARLRQDRAAAGPAPGREAPEPAAAGRTPILGAG